MIHWHYNINVLQCQCCVKAGREKTKMSRDDISEITEFYLCQPLSAQHKIFGINNGPSKDFKEM